MQKFASDEGEAARRGGPQQEPATTSDNANSNQQAATARPSPSKAAPPPHPRQPRPNLLRRQQVIVAAGPNAAPGQQQHLELTGVLPAGAVPLVPPKRPTRLPARYAAGLGIHGQPGGAAGGPAGEKPNRYSWAQMQHWQQAAAAASGGNKAAAAAHQHHFSSPFSSAASRVLVVNPMQIVNLSEHTKSSLIKFIEAIKRFSEKWFSHVLLLMFLAVYACFGAYIFISFEAPTEHWEKQLIIDTRLQIINDTWTEAHKLGAGATTGDESREQFLDLFRTKLEHYERMLNRACASGMTSSSLENQWTFWGALFYSMTVFTTIGYGHLTPVTFAGRVATMVYAIFGIPILLMVLADLGKLLTRIIKYAFKKFRYLFNKLLRRKSSVKTRKLISDNTHQYIGAARNAFERSYAYLHLQPASLRVNLLKQKFSLRPQRNATQADTILGGNGEEAPPQPTLDIDAIRGVADRMEESSEVIVTPAKQTKPVSPPIEGQDKKSLADTVIQAHHAAAAGSSGGHNAHPHHRAQSPAFRIRRKVSTSGLMGSRRHQQQPQQPPPNAAARGSSLAKSSSSKEVPSPSHEPRRRKKNSAGGGSVAEPSTMEPTGKLIKSDPAGTASELGDAATTDETIDVAPEDAFDVEEVEEVEEDGEEIEDEFDIPVSFALFLLVTYMMFGAVVFSIWEGWNFFDSLYFVFISMSTIGFGDLVPQHPKRMIGTFIYLLFGLALTSMCINVVQEKIHATFLRAKMQIGEKMGFDLDQIMADDYYDGSLVYDVEGGAGAEIAEDANSLAVSQTNSATGNSEHYHHHHHHQHHHLLAADDLLDASQRLTSQSLDGAQLQQQNHNQHHHQHHDSPAPVGHLRQSKSRESLKGKKRGSGGSDPKAANSFKRKPSKKVSRQASPSSAASPTATTTMTLSAAGGAASGSGPAPTAGATAQRQQPAMINVMPMRSQLELVPNKATAEMMMPVQQQQQPSINAPINNVQGICEPLRTTTRDELLAGQRTAIPASNNHTGRPKLTSTRSLQPSSPQRQLSSQSALDPTGRQSANIGQRAGSEAPGCEQYHYFTQQRRPPVKSSSYQGRSDLEAALSRRSSVSHELNQLDDLILALGRSPSDKFGPLLGIPSSARSSRSNSPSSAVAAMQLIQPYSTRRGTSMTSRPTYTAAHRNTSPSSIGRKLYNNSGSSGHKSPADQSRESQAALDELEAVTKLQL